jgi:hypothetical protein
LTAIDKAFDKAFGVAESTGRGKAKAIRDLLKLMPEKRIADRQF